MQEFYINNAPNAECIPNLKEYLKNKDNNIYLHNLILVYFVCNVNS